MRNKIVIFFAGYILIIIIGLLSCINKCGPFPDKFKVTKIEWYVCKSVFYDTANINVRLVHSSIMYDSVDYNEYSVWMTLIPQTYFSLVNKINSFSLINSANACSPRDPTTDEKIDSILIFCEKDFDENHLAGDDLSDLFDVVVIDEVNNIYNAKFALTEYLDTKPSVPFEMTLILRNPPAATTEFEFNIKYYQDGIDQDYFEHKTNKVVIRKE